MKIYSKHIFIALFLFLAGMSTFSFAAHAGPSPSTAPATSGANAVTAPGNSATQSGASEVPTTDTKTNNVTLWGLNITDAVNSLLANIVNDVLSTTAFLVSIAASLLSVSIVITLHIKDFVSATPAIFTVWKTIRDITGLFFIFFLLYAAIKMIIGREENLGTLIKNIVIAAILVNFSFFIVSVGIDASNVVSQAIYNSMIPNAATAPPITNITTLSSLAGSVTGLAAGNTSTPSNPQISNIFLNSLKIQTLYNSSGNSVGTAVGSPFKIILIGVVGILIMITTALSFALAAAAFIARLVILLGILAFSPLIFLGEVIPQIRDRGGKIKDIFISQLIFMPIYLLLMYVALSILNNSNLMGAAGATGVGLPNGTNWAFGYVVLAINFVIVIFMLNMPLVIGLSMGGMATGWMSKAMNKVNAANIWKKFGGASYTGTLSRAASAVSRSEGFKDWASRGGVSGALGRLTLKGTRGIATDYNKKLEEQVKSRTDFATSLGYNERKVGELETHLRNLKRQELEFKHGGDEIGRKATKSQIDITESKILAEKKQRQARYSADLAKRGIISAAPNLWTKVARKDKVAAARIGMEIWKKQLDAKKDDLKEAKLDLKRLEEEIRRKPPGTPETPEQTRDKLRFQKDIRDFTSTPESVHKGDLRLMGVNELEKLIEDSKHIK